MKETPGSISFPLAVVYDGWNDGIIFVGISLAAFWVLFTSSYENAPMLIVIPMLILFICGFMFFFLNGLGMILYCVERIEIDEEEIRIKLGPVTARRIPTKEIQTVVYTEQGFGRHTFYHPVLVLSREPAEDIIRKGKQKVDKSNTLWKFLTSRGMQFGQAKAYAYTCYMNNLPLMILGSQKGAVVGYTQTRVDALRWYLRNAEFIV